MEVVTLPPVLHLDEDAVVPVYLQTPDRTAAMPDLPYSDITVKYSRHGDSALQTFNPSTDQWSERGLGMYALSLPGSILNQQGMFQLIVQPVTGAAEFVAFGAIDKRVEERLLEAIPTGYGDDTVGDYLELAANRYEVFGSAQYDAANEKFTITCWLHHNGLRVTNPTSCRVLVKDLDAATTLLDLVSSSPSVDGIFFLEDTPYTLDPNLNLNLVAKITHEGVDYYSIDGAITLN